MIVSASERFRPLVALLLFSGLRISEALGLRWDDIDFREGTIRVRRQVEQPRNVVDILKTDAARRDVILIPELGKVLAAHKLASLRTGAQDFLFGAPDGGPRDQRSTARGIERAVKAAGLEGEGISAHNFRHTFASVLIVGAKRDAVSVAAQLGHSDPSITLRTYSHMFESARSQDETRKALSDGFGHLLATSR